MSLEGIVSKRADAPYTPGNRGSRRMPGERVKRASSRTRPAISR
jgi:hypothetical protein